MKSTILCLVLLFTVLGCGNDDGALAPYIDCSDPEHAGGIAVQLEWDTGSALLRYLCPEEEE